MDSESSSSSTYTPYPDFYETLLGNDRLSVGIQQRRQSAAVAVLYIQVIHTGFLVNIYDSLFQTGGMNLFVYHIKTIFHVIFPLNQ